MERMVSLLIGYLCGCFLTAEWAARWKTGKRARELGSKNPGTANITAQLGLGWGALVLAGDILKTLLACFACRFFFFPALGQIGVLYAGLGAALGHNFPFWAGFSGGKGVAVTCAFLVFYMPLWGCVSCLLGWAVVRLTRSLAAGAAAIPLTGLVFAFLWYGPEAGILISIAAALMLLRNFPGLFSKGKRKEI